jgi:spermidine/putrescine ABC transporter ATP-binding subunit
MTASIDGTMARAARPRGGAIAIADLCKRYGDAIAVDHVSLDVKAGEFVTLLGSSGSGKTTTLMMIAGFVDPDHGSIAVDGRDVVPLPPERRNLGVVFQSYALFPHLSVYENIAFPLRLRGEAAADIDRKVRHVLELVHLADFGARRITQLSGGQQQRVALARAIVFSPPVLLMDEPLGALDRKLREQLQTEIKRVQRDLGVTVVYVTHDQEEALALSDRIAIMSEGRIVQLGNPDEVYEQPVSPFVASFLGESNMLPVRIVSRDHAIVRLRFTDGTEIVQPRGPKGVAEPVPDDAILMLRPEALRLGTDAGAVRGLVQGREFMGATVRYTIASPVGELTVRVARTSAEARLAQGETVGLHWAPEHAILFAADSKPP